MESRQVVKLHRKIYLSLLKLKFNLAKLGGFKSRESVKINIKL